MIKRQITKYEEDGIWYAEAWTQLNIFGKCFCFHKRKIEIYPPVYQDENGTETTFNGFVYTKVGEATGEEVE